MSGPRRFLPALDTDKWEGLKDLNSTLLIAGLAYLFGCAFISLAWLRKEVPLAERRHATLERRSLDDFVPRWARIATYALVGINLAAWLIGRPVGDSTPHPSSGYALALVIGLSACFFFMTRVGVNRRPNAMDRIFARVIAGARCAYGFAMQLISADLDGSVRLYEEVADTVRRRRQPRLAPGRRPVRGLRLSQIRAVFQRPRRFGPAGRSPLDSRFLIPNPNS